MTRQPVCRPGDDGVIAVISALLAVLLFAFGALAVDLGNLQARKRATQGAADLATLAGAQGLPNVAQAKQYALDYLKKNPVEGESYAACPACYSDNDAPDFANGEIIVTNNAGGIATGTTDGYRIRVIVPRRTVTFALAGVLGFSSSTVHAAATAGVGSPAKGKILPFGVAAGAGGLYCIHDNTNGHNAVLRSALLANPAITLNPTTVSTAGGDRVTVTGTATSFKNNSSDVYYNGVLMTAIAVTVNSTTSASFVAPARAAGTVQVTVVSKNGSVTETTAPATLTYATPAPGAPTVTSINPSTGPAGTSVTIAGTGFTPAATVRFGAAAASAVYNSATRLTASAPAGSGTVDVVVTVGAQSSATSAADRYTYPAAGPAPTVTGVSPASGQPGDTVTVTGTGFAPGTVFVSFGGNAATGVTVTSSTQLTAVAPAGTGAVDVIVTVNGVPSASSAADQFTYTVDPCVSSTGNFGYLDFKGYKGANLVEQNIILGAQYPPGIFPPALLPPVNTECTADGSPPGAIRDNGTDNGYNCVDIKNGNTVSTATQALLDGINNPSLPPRLENPPVPPCSKGTVKTRPNIENDSLQAFLTVPLATFENSLATNAPPTAGIIKKEIYDCPRFFLVPAMNISGNQQNGFYPITGFLGCFIETFQTNGGGRQVTAIQAYVFSLDWIASPGAGGGVIPYLGSGPRVPMLVHDAFDLPH